MIASYYPTPQEQVQAMLAADDRRAGTVMNVFDTTTCAPAARTLGGVLFDQFRSHPAATRLTVCDQHAVHADFRAQP